LLESDLAWAPTHTLINPFTEVVDHSAANSILAAGTGGMRSPTVTNMTERGATPKDGGMAVLAAVRD
jgi:hypothetical protein